MTKISLDDPVEPGDVIEVKWTPPLRCDAILSEGEIRYPGVRGPLRCNLNAGHSGAHCVVIDLDWAIVWP